jgi:hypothetical protein
VFGPQDGQMLGGVGLLHSEAFDQCAR